MKTIVVTGYKPIEMGIFKYNDPKIVFVKAAIKKRVAAMIEEGLEWVLISGQMGVELWAAQVIMDLKEEYFIQLGVIPPFENQQERWPEEWQHAYEEVTMMADFYQPVYNKEYQGPYQFKAKDQFLVEHSQGCLVLYDEDTKGSPDFFLKAAKKLSRHYSILYITPLDLEETVEEMRMQDPDYWSE
ncbi:SLOG family protein [Halobacillus rhizosphaerae]|uniref:SLOG family protein n=1 Tax=Halobacillus rhizosphaerae TaxID=3064889 RepID=UPI00398B6045